MQFIAMYLLCGFLWAAYFIKDGIDRGIINDAIQERIGSDVRFTTLNSEEKTFVVKLIVIVSFVGVALIWPKIVIQRTIGKIRSLIKG